MSFSLGIQIAQCMKKKTLGPNVGILCTNGSLGFQDTLGDYIGSYTSSGFWAILEEPFQGYDLKGATLQALIV